MTKVRSSSLVLFEIEVQNKLILQLQKHLCGIIIMERGIVPGNVFIYLVMKF